MRIFCLIFLVIHSGLGWGEALKVGDILLQPLDCWVCRLIEAEEESPYSHMGVVLSVDPLLVGEAYGSVKVITFSAFNSKTKKGQHLLALRPKGSFQAGKKALTYFKKHFEGLSYDEEFLWDNVDALGKDKLYCSELVTKFFEGLYGMNFPLKRMHFRTNVELWMTYFKGKIPNGEWGNSPADFEKSELFRSLGEI